MTKFLANENFSGASVNLLKRNGSDILWNANSIPDISNQQVMELAIKDERIILTHDSDY